MYIFENIWECWIFTKHWTKFRNGIKTPIRIEYGIGFRYFLILEEIRVHFWRKYFNDYLHIIFYIKYRDVYKMYFFDGIFHFFFDVLGISQSRSSRDQNEQEAVRPASVGSDNLYYTRHLIYILLYIIYDISVLFIFENIYYIRYFIYNYIYIKYSIYV